MPVYEYKCPAPDCLHEFEVEQVGEELGVGIGVA